MSCGHFRLRCNVRLDLSRDALAAQLRIWFGARIMCSMLETQFGGSFLSSAFLDKQIKLCTVAGQRQLHVCNT